VNHKLVLIPLLVAVLAVAATASALRAATPQPRALPKKPSVALARVNPSVTRRVRASALRWEIVMGRPHVRFAAPLDTRRALRFWRHRRLDVLRLAAHPPHKSGWLCIQRYEASWSDSGDPYWGGLQMDRGFMRTYAPRLLLRRGLANRWTALEQMWVAERAHRNGRGYWPWTNTARACGLL
jgi:hypothetical protein